MNNIWKQLTPEERRVALILRRKQIEEREAEFYRIHGEKKGRPTNADKGNVSNVRQVS